MKKPADVLTTATLNCLIRALSRECVTAEYLQSLSDNDLRAIRNLGAKSITAIRAEYPFDPALQESRLRWRPELLIPHPKLIDPGNLSSRMMSDVTSALSMYCTQLTFHDFSPQTTRELLGEFHRALLRHWFPALPDVDEEAS